MAAQRRLKTVEAPQRTMPDLRASVNAAIERMDWLTESDEAMCDVARAIADTIETAVSRADELAALLAEAPSDLMRRIQKLEAHCDVAKTVGWQGPLLQGVLRDLGGAPKARKEMQTDSPTGSRLAQLRAGLVKPTDSPST